MERAGQVIGQRAHQVIPGGRVVLEPRRRAVAGLPRDEDVRPPTRRRLQEARGRRRQAVDPLPCPRLGAGPAEADHPVPWQVQAHAQPAPRERRKTHAARDQPSSLPPRWRTPPSRGACCRSPRRRCPTGTAGCSRTGCWPASPPAGRRSPPPGDQRAPSLPPPPRRPCAAGGTDPWSPLPRWWPACRGGGAWRARSASYCACHSVPGHGSP